MNAPWFTVVGVVGDMRRQGRETAPIPSMFEPLAQNPSRLVTLLVRTSLDDPMTMVGAVQACAYLAILKSSVFFSPSLRCTGSAAGMRRSMKDTSKRSDGSMSVRAAIR